MPSRTSYNAVALPLLCIVYSTNLTSNQGTPVPNTIVFGSLCRALGFSMFGFVCMGWGERIQRLTRADRAAAGRRAAERAGGSAASSAASCGKSATRSIFARQMRAEASAGCCISHLCRPLPPSRSLPISAALYRPLQLSAALCCALPHCTALYRSLSLLSAARAAACPLPAPLTSTRTRTRWASRW